MKRPPISFPLGLATAMAAVMDVKPSGAVVLPRNVIPLPAHTAGGSRPDLVVEKPSTMRDPARGDSEVRDRNRARKRRKGW